MSRIENFINKYVENPGEAPMSLAAAEMDLRRSDPALAYTNEANAVNKAKLEALPDRAFWLAENLGRAAFNVAAEKALELVSPKNIPKQRPAEMPEVMVSVSADQGTSGEMFVTRAPFVFGRSVTDNPVTRKVGLYLTGEHAPAGIATIKRTSPQFDYVKTGALTTALNAVDTVRSERAAYWRGALGRGTAENIASHDSEADPFKGYRGEKKSAEEIYEEINANLIPDGQET